MRCRYCMTLPFLSPPLIHPIPLQPFRQFAKRQSAQLLPAFCRLCSSPPQKASHFSFCPTICFIEPLDTVCPLVCLVFFISPFLVLFNVALARFIVRLPYSRSLIIDCYKMVTRHHGGSPFWILMDYKTGEAEKANYLIGSLLVVKVIGKINFKF
jgi:hypothetical protein